MKQVKAPKGVKPPKAKAPKSVKTGTRKKWNTVTVTSHKPAEPVIFKDADGSDSDASGSDGK